MFWTQVPGSKFILINENDERVPIRIHFDRKKFDVYLPPLLGLLLILSDHGGGLSTISRSSKWVVT